MKNNESRIALPIRVLPVVSKMVKAEAASHDTSPAGLVERWAFLHVASPEAKQILLKYGAQNPMVAAVKKVEREQQQLPKKPFAKRPKNAA